LSRPALVVTEEKPTKVGQAVLVALEGSKEGISHPTQWKGRFDPILQLAHVPSWNAFVETTKCVQIELESDEVSFIPTRNLGARDGFEPIQDKIRCFAGSAELVGAALLTAFEKAE
jgi:hypothetical protein